MAEVTQSVPHWMGRTKVLLGEERVVRLINSHVFMVGLGGIGGICAEMICRAGVGKMTIIDADTVDPTNRNRQIPALSSTEGKLKTEVLGARLKDINPQLDLVMLPEYIKGQEWTLLDNLKPDYVVDCIDTLSCKVWFIRACLEKKIPIVSSMGAGGKVDPSKVRITDISETYNCKLTQNVRKKLHRWGIYGGFDVVWSTEDIDKGKVISTPNDDKKASVIGTISYMPAIFGCTVASVVIRDLYNGIEKKLQLKEEPKVLKNWRGEVIHPKKERKPHPIANTEVQNNDTKEENHNANDTTTKEQHHNTNNTTAKEEHHNTDETKNRDKTPLNSN